MRAARDRRKKSKGRNQPFNLSGTFEQIEYFIIRLLLVGLLLIAAYDLVSKQAQMSRICR